MRAHSHHDTDLSLTHVENWMALGAGAFLLVAGASRRSAAGVCVAAASAPLLYRGLTGRWPRLTSLEAPETDARRALANHNALQIREAIRLEVPIAEVYRFWRRLENLPRFMSHLDRVLETGPGRSHWVAIGPGGVRVEWDAEITDEIENRTLAWRSLPGSDIVTAGSVSFDVARQGRSTEVAVDLRYAPPAGRAGALAAFLSGRAPSQTIREDLRRFKQILEAGELARAVPESEGVRQ